MPAPASSRDVYAVIDDLLLAAQLSSRLTLDAESARRLAGYQRFLTRQAEHLRDEPGLLLPLAYAQPLDSPVQADVQSLETQGVRPGGPWLRTLNVPDTDLNPGLIWSRNCPGEVNCVAYWPLRPMKHRSSDKMPEERIAVAAGNVIQIRRARTGELLNTLTGHALLVRSVAWSPDGLWIASGSADHTVRVWDAWSGAERFTMNEHTNWVESVEWSPDGYGIASGSRDHTVCVWDSSTGKQRHKLTGHEYGVSSVGWSPDSRWIVSGCQDGTVRVWDSVRATARQTIHTNGINSVVWSADGQWIATCDDWSVNVWDASRGTLRCFLGRFGFNLYGMSWSSSGHWIALAGERAVICVPLYTACAWAVIGNESDSLPESTLRSGAWTIVSTEPSNVRLVESDTFSKWMIFPGHTEKVRSVAWSPDGTLIISGGDDWTIRLWDVSSGVERPKLKGHTNRVHSVGWSPDGRWIVTGNSDGVVRIQDALTGAVRHKLIGHEFSIYSVAWSSDGNWIVSGSRDGTVRVWNAETGDAAFTISKSAPSCTSEPVFDRWIATGSNDRLVRVWDMMSGQVQHFLTGHMHIVTSVSFSPDRRWVASGSKDETVRVWDASCGTERHILTGHTKLVSNVAWCPNSLYIASGSADRTVRVWDASNGVERHALTGHTGGISSVTWSPDGRWIVSGSADNTVRVWNAISGKLIAWLPLDASVTNVSVTGQNTLRIAAVTSTGRLCLLRLEE